jgi:Ca2+-binding EF-hand superfamily protein
VPASLITLRDFLLASETLRVKLTPQQAKAIFDMLDKDGNGKLSLIEFSILANPEKR